MSAFQHLSEADALALGGVPMAFLRNETSHSRCAGDRWQSIPHYSWRPHDAMQDRNMTICDGERSRIVCAMQPNRKHARYCVFHRLLLDESAATSSGGGRSLFTAHCRPTAAWAQLDPAAGAAHPSPRALAASDLFAGMGTFSPFKWVARQSVGAGLVRIEPRVDRWPAPDPRGTAPHLTPPRSSEPAQHGGQRLSLLLSGDCGLPHPKPGKPPKSSGNPGHC